MAASTPIANYEPTSLPLVRLCIHVLWFVAVKRSPQCDRNICPSEVGKDLRIGNEAIASSAAYFETGGEACRLTHITPVSMTAAAAFIRNQAASL